MELTEFVEVIVESIFRVLIVCQVWMSADSTEMMVNESASPAVTDERKRD